MTNQLRDAIKLAEGELNHAKHLWKKTPRIFFLARARRKGVAIGCDKIFRLLFAQAESLEETPPQDSQPSLPDDEERERILRLIKERDQQIAEIRIETERLIENLLADPICCHEFTKWHGDPSGGSDSHRECLVCGEYLPKPNQRQ